MLLLGAAGRKPSQRHASAGEGSRTAGTAPKSTRDGLRHTPYVQKASPMHPRAHFGLPCRTPRLANLPGEPQGAHSQPPPSQGDLPHHESQPQPQHDPKRPSKPHEGHPHPAEHPEPAAWPHSGRGAALCQQPHAPASPGKTREQSVPRPDPGPAPSPPSSTRGQLQHPATCTFQRLQGTGNCSGLKLLCMYLVLAASCNPTHYRSSVNQQQLNKPQRLARR